MKPNTSDASVARTQALFSQKSSQKNPDEIVEPMVPHKSRNDVDADPNPHKQPDAAEVVEPMIPHQKREDME
jgi:hypothetical protein